MPLALLCTFKLLLGPFSFLIRINLGNQTFLINPNSNEKH